MVEKNKYLWSGFDLLDFLVRCFWLWWDGVSVGERSDDLERKIYRKPSWAYWYARDVIKERWPEAEELILSSQYGGLYRREFNV